MDTIEKKHNINLDLVRLAAMIMVFLVHLGQRYPVLGEWTTVGAKGVILFFIMSGYLINVSIEKSSSWKDYIKKRVIRIIPLYYIVLIFIYVWDLVRYTWSWGWRAALAGPCSPVKYLRYFLFAQVLLPSQDSSLWCNRYALWTMSSFAFFYVLAYILFKGIRKYRQSLLLLILLLLSREAVVAGIQNILDQTLHYTDTYFAYHTPLSMLYCFVFGTTLYYAVKEKKEFSYLFLMAGVLILGQFTWYRFEMIFTILVYMALKAPDIVNNDKIRKVIKFAGDGSFSFYLCHMFLFSVLDYVTKRLPLSQWGNLIFSVLFIVSVSYTIWWFIARPIEQRLRQRWLQS